jgi:hypothetical protein
MGGHWRTISVYGKGLKTLPVKLNKQKMKKEQRRNKDGIDRNNTFVSSVPNLNRSFRAYSSTLYLPGKISILLLILFIITIYPRNQLLQIGLFICSASKRSSVYLKIRVADLGSFILKLAHYILLLSASSLYKNNHLTGVFFCGLGYPSS